MEMSDSGHGRTMGTYELLLQTFDEEGRVEEADALFEKILTENEECTPQNLFHHVIAMHERYNQPKRLLQVFADMEELGVRPDMQTVYRVARTYETLGLLKRKELVIQKYPPPTVELKRVKGGRPIGLWVFKQKEGDNFLQEIPTDENMEDNDEGDHDWSDGEQDGEDDSVQLSTFNSDENFNDEDDGVWSNGRQDGECRLLVLNLHDGYGNIKDEDERNCPNERQNARFSYI
ncbi:unnamed protein product [Sphagnum jensenii]